eukprot:941659-Amphidinium_carterae.1
MSALEEPMADTQQMVFGGQSRRAVARSPRTNAPALASAKASGGGCQRGSAAREGAIAAMSKAGLQRLPAKSAMAAPKRRTGTVADLAVTMTTALEALTERIGALEADRRQNFKATSPLAAGGWDADATSALYLKLTYHGSGAASSLLAPGRVMGRPQGPPRPLAQPGERAY